MSALEREGDELAARSRREHGSAPTNEPATMPSFPASPGAKDGGPDEAPGNLVLSPREDSVAQGPVRVLSIERHGSDRGARVVIHLSGPATFQVGSLDADASSAKDVRVYVDIAGATSRGVPREVEVGGVLRRVRVGAQPKGTRVVLDLADRLHRRVFYLPEPFRIIVDVSTRAPLRAEASAPGQAREVRRVVLDPGHGGNDTGAVGPTGLREKDVALDIAHRVAPLLARELKIETLLTRDGDTYVPLELRTARANAFHADLFVSIHCNASENGQARGVQTFSLDRESEGAGARVAARENAARRDAAVLVGTDLQMAAVFSSLNVGALASRSRHLADLVQRSALASLTERYPDTRDQGVKGAGFYVLAGADMPAILFETSFISNPEDESRLATADYRQKLADSIVNAVRAYREGK